MQLGRYRLESLVGEGGTARVFRAQDTTRPVSVAVKVFRRDLVGESQLLERFHTEIELLRRFDHPNLLPCLAHGHDEALGVPWFATRLCRGSLAGRIYQNGPLEVTTVASYCAEILDGLAHIHEAGIVHRDVKPDNIMLDDDDVAVLGDFGIALNPDDRPTHVNAIMGTPQYMAPEQHDDPRHAEPSADLFAVGSTLFVSITGRSSMTLFLNERRSAALDQLPDSIRPFVDKATAVDPSKRFASAREMADALADFM